MGLDCGVESSGVHGCSMPVRQLQFVETGTGSPGPRLASEHQSDVGDERLDDPPDLRVRCGEEE